eukprot:6317246-Prorocentrum_lima.AAC.1
MTSSLVGSEMCIRDSYQRVLITMRDVRHKMNQMRIARVFFRGKIDGPVSYTHLTLPTICSV